MVMKERKPMPLNLWFNTSNYFNVISPLLLSPSHCPSWSILSPNFFLYVYLSICLSVSLCLSPSIYLSIYLYLSLSISFPLPHSLCPFLAASDFMTVCLFYVSGSFCLFASLFSLSLAIFLCIIFSSLSEYAHTLSSSFSLPLFPFICLSDSLSIYFSLSISF